MFEDEFSRKMSNDWLWREKELRALDSLVLKDRSEINMKTNILILYAHWEGHFKFCANQLVDYIYACISKKVFQWTDIKEEIRLRLVFCSYKRSGMFNQSQENFFAHLNSINDKRHLSTLKARDEIIMIDDNLNTLRAENICKNLGIDVDWFILKKIIIDDRIILCRNAIAHGSSELRFGDRFDILSDVFSSSVEEFRNIIREVRNRFDNSIQTRSFLA